MMVARIITHDSQDILKANRLISPESLQAILRFSSDCPTILAAVQPSNFLQGEARDVHQIQARTQYVTGVVSIDRGQPHRRVRGSHRRLVAPTAHAHCRCGARSRLPRPECLLCLKVPMALPRLALRRPPSSRRPWPTSRMPTPPAHKCSIIYMPQGTGPFPLVVNIHPGGFFTGDKGMIPGTPAKAMLAAGYAVASIELSLVGRGAISGGGARRESGGPFPARQRRKV